MSFISTLTWSCIEIQSVIENLDVREAEKNATILKHLSSLEECTDREAFPEFDLGWEWFNVKRGLTVNGDFKDQIVIVDFFTYCCINCMHILPDLHALEEKYPSDKTGVVVVGVHSAKFENEKVSRNIMAAVQRYDIHHPVVNDSEAVLWKKLEITCWPTLLILGPDSKPLFVIIGEGHRNVLFRYVQNALLFYKHAVVPRPLPLLLNSLEIFQSHLLFPGKVCIVECECIEGNAKEDATYIAVSDTGHHRILIISQKGEIKMTIGGPTPGWEEGVFESAKFRSPQGMAFLPPCYLYVADTGNHSVRKVDLSTKNVRTVAGTGIQGTDKEGGKSGVEQPLASPWDLCLAHSPTSDDPDILIIANAGTHQIWGLALRNLTWWKKLQVEAGTCFPLAGSGAEENRNNSYPAKAAFAQPSGICCATLQARSSEYLLFVADSESSSIRQVNLNDGSVKGVVGGDKDPMNLFSFGDKDNNQDPKCGVLLQHPLAVAWNSAKSLLYVADSYNHKIKTVDPSTKVCSTFVGNGKAGLINGDVDGKEIQFNEPGGLCMNAEGSIIYVADTNNHCIRKIDMRNLSLQFVETLKIHAKPVEQSRELTIHTDFEVSASLPSRISNVEWTVTFQCSNQWKWSEEAPHTWKIMYLEGLSAEEKMGEINKGQMKILFCPQFAATSDIGKEGCLLVQTQLFLCALVSGVCTKKSITIRLKIAFDENSSGESSKIHHNLSINAD